MHFSAKGIMAYRCFN